jgi:hypothetical protein
MPVPLARALPGAEFTEHHDLVVGAPREHVWSALRATRWSDLRVSLPLLAVRGLGALPPSGEAGLLLGPGGPTPLVLLDPPRYAAGAAVARPWQLRPSRGPRIGSLDDLASFDDPGWLKMGMDFSLHPLSGDRTRLATSTWCEPTDEEARRRFARYWRVVRPFSGLIRMDLLRAVARRCPPHQGP